MPSAGLVDGRPAGGRFWGRRPPLLVLMLLGAALAIGYGRVILGMRFGPPLVMVGLGGMTLALCATALWRVIDPLTRAAVAIVPETRAPHRVRELEREKQAVLKAIKEIELDFQMRKISEADYREMVERYRARALRILGDLAAGDDYRALIERELRDRMAAARTAAGAQAGGATTEASTQARMGTSTEASTEPEPNLLPSSCEACGITNDPDARFCKKCGQKLTIPDDSA